VRVAEDGVADTAKTAVTIWSGRNCCSKVANATPPITIVRPAAARTSCSSNTAARTSRPSAVRPEIL
jgi:hypothetical protein